MKPLPKILPTLLQENRCARCFTYIDGVCHNPNDPVSGRKFHPDNTCIHHSAGNGHLADTRGGVYNKPAFTKHDIREVQDRYILDGKTTVEIAKERGVSYARVYNYTKLLSKEVVKC